MNPTDQELIERRGCSECERLHHEIQRMKPDLRMLGIALRLMRSHVILREEAEDLGKFVAGLLNPADVGELVIGVEKPKSDQPKSEGNPKTETRTPTP
jgi:hypothetical protein